MDVDNTKRIFSKMHFALSNQHPHIDKTAGSIYVVCHPKDVLLSNLNYFRLTGHTGINEIEFVRTFIKNKGLPVWRQAGMGSWSEHIASWKNKADSS